MVVSAAWEGGDGCPGGVGVLGLIKVLLGHGE